MSHLRVGIFGGGFMASAHTDCLKELGAQVCAVAGRSEEKLRKFCEEKELQAGVYTDFREMLDRESLDAVYFCIPPGGHNGEVELAAERGLHVFLEKPIALNAEAARKMVEAIEKAGVKCQVGYMMRFRKSVQALKARIDSGEAGRPTLFRGRFWVNMEGGAWWRDAAQSGGQMFEQVTHIYDMARYLCGDVATAEGLVANLLHQNREDYTIEDTNGALLHFENGAIGVITGSNCAAPMHFFADFSAVFENATYEYTCTGQPWVEADKAVLYNAEGEKETFVEDGNSFLDENRDFVEAIREDRPTLCPAREGLATIEVIERVLAAARKS